MRRKATTVCELVWVREVKKYRREDVLPALRCQREVIRAVRMAWWLWQKGTHGIYYFHRRVRNLPMARLVGRVACWEITVRYVHWTESWKGIARAAIARALVCKLAHDCGVEGTQRDPLMVLQHFGWCFAWTPEWVLACGYWKDGHSDWWLALWVHR